MVILFIFFFIFMLLFPTETFQGALSGLYLWFQTVLPTLLPFAIISNLLIQTNTVFVISKWMSPILSRVFNVSAPATYAIFVGFLCGYPMGAKAISDLIMNKQISQKEGQYLLSFCNNTSPIFIISFVVTQHFQDNTLLFPTLLILTFSPILCSFYFRKYYKSEAYIKQKTEDLPICFHFNILDNAIMNGFETLTKVGGYIILFSILFRLGKHLNIPFLMPFLEITNGIPYITNMNISFKIKYVITLCLTSFGGICAIFQTNSMIHDVGLSIKKYQKEKLITAMVTSLLAYVYISIIRS